MLSSIPGAGLVLLFLFSSTLAEEDDLFGLSVEEDTDPRLFFANYTASLISVNSTILSYALVGISIAVRTPSSPPL